MGNVYTRMQSETSEDENAGQSQKRNDAIVFFHKIVMGDFKEWYNTSRYFAVDTPVRKDVKLDVGQTKKANLTVNIIKSRGSDDQIRVQIINASDFEICLGGEVYCVEGEIRHKIMSARTPTVLLRTLASSCATIVQSNLRPTSHHDGGRTATDLFLDVSDVVPQSATLVFEFKFFPLNLASKKSVSKMERDGASALLRDISEIRNNSEIADVTIHCDKKYFVAHKTILAGRSSVFAAMFRHRGTTERDTGVVTIEDCDKKTMEMFLAYVYGGNLPGYTFDVAAALINVATKYNVRSLMDTCNEILRAHLNEANAIQVALLGDLYGVKALKKAALVAIAKSKKPLKTMNGWDELDRELQIEIIDFKASR